MDHKQYSQPQAVAGDWNCWIKNVSRNCTTWINNVSRNCTTCVAKTKALICVFVFADANCWFSYDAAHINVSKVLVVITKDIGARWSSGKLRSGKWLVV